MSTHLFRRAGAIAALATLAACADSASSVLVPDMDASFGRVPINQSPAFGVADIEYFEVCKQYVGAVGPAVTIDVFVDRPSLPTDTTFQVTLANGQCRDVWLHGGQAETVTVTEQPVAGYTTSFVKEVKTRTSYTVDPVASGNSASGAVSGLPGEGALVRFINTEIPPSGELGNFVWIDLNSDGRQDPGEPGIPGVTVTLSGAANATTTTDANGYYLFSGLYAGDYTVTVGAGIPAGYTPTTSLVGTPDLDSNGSPANVTLPTNSSSDLTIDFGYVAPPPPPPGCTYTQGYWKNHSAAGPAPYDAGWKKIGVLEHNTPFFNSGMTWLVLWNTPPKKGNVYIQLAHQYMAAKLNVLNGASAPANVLSAISTAETYFSTGTGNITGLATLLDNYNNGLIGPGHCS